LHIGRQTAIIMASSVSKFIWIMASARRLARPTENQIQLSWIRKLPHTTWHMCVFAFAEVAEVEAVCGAAAVPAASESERRAIMLQENR
jgi:hypothetical protein